MIESCPWTRVHAYLPWVTVTIYVVLVLAYLITFHRKTLTALRWLLPGEEGVLAGETGSDNIKGFEKTSRNAVEKKSAKKSVAQRSTSKKSPPKEADTKPPEKPAASKLTQTVFCLWNFGLAVFSGIGALRTVPVLVYLLSTRGLTVQLCLHVGSII
jgi:hypothetical protein